MKNLHEQIFTVSETILLFWSAFQIFTRCLGIVIFVLKWTKYNISIYSSEFKKIRTTQICICYFILTSIYLGMYFWLMYVRPFVLELRLRALKIMTLVNISGTFFQISISVLKIKLKKSNKWKEVKLLI